MGNRAVITFNTNYSAPCVYIHWNGGRCSIEAFLKAAREFGIQYMDNETDKMDALAEMLDRFFFMGISVYRELYGEADTNNGDNGVYIITQGLLIMSRLHAIAEEEINPDKTEQIYATIMGAVWAEFG